MTSRFVIHIGAPKSGSTFVQDVLWTNRDFLATQGIELPGVRQRAHFAAGNDLLGPADSFVQRVRQGPGSGGWDRLAAEIGEMAAPTLIVTDERLAALSPAAIGRVSRDVAEREAHVVYLVRCLQDILPSAWQMEVRQGGRATFDDWLAAVLDPNVERSGSWFWRVHDAPAVLDRWAQLVARPGNVHVVTIPRSSGGPVDLWQRFSAAADLPGEVVVGDRVRRNPSLDFAQTEYLRRVNVELGDTLDAGQYRRIVRIYLSSRIMSRSATGMPPRMKTAVATSVAHESERIIGSLQESGFDIVGDLADLVPVPDRYDDGASPDAEEVLGAGVTALAQLLAHGGQRLIQPPGGQSSLGESANR